MRIVQLIDSLDIGGAEKMAVNYANSLAERIEFSGLAVTRKEGELKSQLNENVDYLFLNRKSVFDAKAVFSFKFWLKKNKIDFIHAHGTSYFFAFLVKLLYPKIGLIWHEHLGARSTTSLKNNRVLWICSFFFKGIIVVNQSLKTWCNSILRCKDVLVLPNYIIIQDEENTTILKGLPSKRIVCIANLKKPKNHLFLIEIAKKVNNSYKDWTFHLVGKDYEDEYSTQLKQKIKAYEIDQNVFIYGSKRDTCNILNQAEIAILTSTSEGLPVSLIEYGFMKKAVVVTAVGEIPFVIENGNNGYVVSSEDLEEFSNALISLIENQSLRAKFGTSLQLKMHNDYSERKVIDAYLKWIEKI